MEKIYMENNNNKKQSQISQIMNAKLPHHLSALMIMVAFVSFIAMGFSQESYSLTQEELGDTFETVGYASVSEDLKNYSYKRVVSNDSNIPVPYIYNKQGIQLFCLQKDGGMPENSVPYAISSPKSKVDKGVTYILSRKGNLGISNNYIETWVIQVAIWKYQYDKGEPTAASMENYIAALERNQDSQIWVFDPNDVSHREELPATGLYNTYIAPLVASAKTATGTSIAITKASGDLTVTDNNYYKSQVMTVTGLNSGSTYSLKLVNAPSGTKVYKNDGTEITNLSSIPAGTNQFYLLVPINKVTEDTKNLTVSVTGPSSVAYIYNPTTTPTSGGTYQTLTAPVDEVASVGVDLTYAPDVPDTGMSTAQSVYFIGLVILLCGIGIIYANAKPRKSE